MLGQGKPKESIGSQLHLGRHPALEGVGSWSELLIAVLPQPKAVKVGEEHCFEGGKAWLTSHFEEATGLECFYQMMHVG